MAALEVALLIDEDIILRFHQKEVHRVRSSALMPPRFFAALFLVVAVTSTLPSAGFSASSSCQATATIMNPAAESTNLPRWDLSRFGFPSPFSEEIDSHLEETAKLAEAFKVRTALHLHQKRNGHNYVCSYISFSPLITLTL